MDAMTLSSKSLTCLIIIYNCFVVSVEAADPEVPDSAWPLTDRTEGYDVLTDTNTAVVCGGQFTTKGFVLSNSSVCDGHHSYVDIDLDLSFSEDIKFTIVVDILIEGEATGSLFTFSDSGGKVWFESSVRKEYTYLKLEKKWGECKNDNSEKLIPTGFHQLALKKSGGDFKLYRENKESCKAGVTDDTKKMKGRYVPGKLRVGLSLNTDAPNGIFGKVSCVRLYKDEVDLNHVGIKGECITGNWLYTGPYPCMASPCSHGGICSNTISPRDFHCDCVPGYTGKDCGTDIDDCLSEPCLHEGTCKDKVDGFSCLCTPHFIGSTCEEVKKRPVNGGGLYKIVANVKPDNSTAIGHRFVTGDIQCGLVCTRTEDCLSFALINKHPSQSHPCILFNSTQQPTEYSPNTKYYKLGP